MSILKENTEVLETKIPIKVVQFGQGVFLRGFVDYAIQQLNKQTDFNAGVAIVKPRAKGSLQLFEEQKGLFTLFTKGVKEGSVIEENELISVIRHINNPYSDFEDFLSLAKLETLKFVVSNTTESGIKYLSSDIATMQPPDSFPAKFTILLVERFKHFKGDLSKGLSIIPCELIEQNADVLKEIILRYASEWNLGKEFANWVNQSNHFYNTLVDRIVPGYPKDTIELYNKELGYKDELMVVAEPYFLWAIEAGEALKQELPFHKTNLNVKIVSDIESYRTQKVRILNGVHTAIFALSFMYGNETVKETMDNSFTQNFVNTMVAEEIIPSMNENEEDLHQYANEVFDRFRNPFIKHLLASLSLNAISKFKARVLPSLLDYVSIHHKIPTHLTYAFACVIRYYKGIWKEEKSPITDSSDIIDYFISIWKLNSYTQIAENLLRNIDFWEQDLTKINNLTSAVSYALEEIEKNGIEIGFVNFSKEY